MSHEHVFDCRLVWAGAREGRVVDYESYSRELSVDVEGKPRLCASAAPAFRGDASLWNPEDLLVAALAACHCLSYLSLCARARVSIVAYEDRAHGTMERRDGVIRFVDVLLRPRVTLADGADRAKALALHTNAHKECFIASSVNFPVRHEAEIA